jgi:hypothetical protein
LCIAAAGVVAAIDASASADKGDVQVTTSGLTPAKQAVETQLNDHAASLASQAADPAANAAIIAAKKDGIAQMSSQALSAKSGQNSDWPEGVFQDSEAPAPGSQFIGQNRWVGTSDGVQVAVYAGQAGFDENTGRVLIVFNGRGAAEAAGYDLDLTGSGPLHVLSGSDGMVVLADASGAQHVLDIAKHAWAS